MTREATTEITVTETPEQTLARWQRDTEATIARIEARRAEDRTDMINFWIQIACWVVAFPIAFIALSTTTAALGAGFSGGLVLSYFVGKLVAIIRKASAR